jgi:K(+)-stimulated pyrophosphate-energized sodium pump
MLGIAGIILAAAIYYSIVRTQTRPGRQVEIAGAIRRGAVVFLGQEFAYLGIFAIVVSLAMGFALDWITALLFLLGVVFSALAGFAGMQSATRANLRTAMAAHESGINAAFTVAFASGSVMGLLVASFGLLGLGSIYAFFGQSADMLRYLTGFGIGASSTALFARVGGGIYTKTADVGADLVGKIEQGIPEDDPRNPGVIADLVGDNVGDVAGMGADLFESYAGSIIAAIAIAATLSYHSFAQLGRQEALLFLPLALAGLGLLASIIGIFLVRLFASRSPETALWTGMLTAAVIFIAISWQLMPLLGVDRMLWYCVLAGTTGGLFIGMATAFFTQGAPVDRIAAAGESGPATVIITGLAVGMQSMAIPLIVLVAVIYVSSHTGGLFGIAIAAVSMLGTTGIIMAVDAYGPVVDNAGGIVQITGLGDKARSVTDHLDELGNTTAAIGKGFAVGAAALTALAMISAFVQTVRIKFPEFELLLTDPQVLMGMFLGGLIPYLFAAMTMTAVGTAAAEMVEEIRRQFREIPGLLSGTESPDNDRCMNIATRAALSRMVAPAALAILTPPLVGFVMGPHALGGFLGGAVLSGVLLGLLMSNAGAAWDNAKKHVEQGHLGGKGSPVHNACIVGDTVGDPFKDTAGPSMNILIKLMAIISLFLVPYL